MRKIIFLLFIILGCSKTPLRTLDILAIMDNPLGMQSIGGHLTVINRNDFTITDMDILINGTYKATLASLAPGERHKIPVQDFIDTQGVAFSMKRMEYRTFTVRAAEGRYKGTWKK